MTKSQEICWFNVKQDLDEMPICIYQDACSKPSNCVCLSRGEDSSGYYLNCVIKEKKDLLWYFKSIRYNKKIEKLSELEFPISDLGRQNIGQIIELNIYAKQNELKYNKLTTREKEVLAHIARGLKNKEIADLLEISLDTAKQHRKIIKRKLQLGSLAELLYFAKAFGL